MYNNFKYPVKIEPDNNDTFLVTFPDIAEAITFGDTREQALANAVYCLDTALAYRIKDKQDIPIASKAKNYSIVTPSTLVVMKVILYIEMKEQGIKKADLIRLMGCEAKTIDRIVDVKHKSTLPLMDKAFMAMGKHIVIGIEDMRT